MMSDVTKVRKTLTLSTQFWLISLIAAQIVFVLYLILGYGLSTVENQLEAWNKFNDTAFKDGDTLGNLAYGMHVLLAIVMIVGGTLQLLPQIRQRFIVFHKFNGRVFVVLACTISLAGMYLITSRGTVGDLFMHSMTFFSGLVVLLASFLAVKAARSRNIKLHSEWAIRLFLAANGVLFFRLIIFAWFMVFGALGVNTDDFTGPTVYAVSVSAYLLPLVIFEWYRRLHRQLSDTSKLTSVQSNIMLKTYAISICLILIGMIFLIGLFGITLGSWYPSLFTA
ncbi:hypothetical protein KUL10_17070 [Glaciecola sp. KUL10]|nr:hypothetical protein KUL10_17070 [Glaciecola sp. KUL10]